MQQSNQAAVFSRAMTFLKGLRILMMDFHYNRKINDDAISILCRKIAIHKKLKAVEFNFSCCREITDIGIMAISNQLYKVTRLNNFQMVAKECEGITNAGLKYLANTFSKLKLKSLHLDFKNCCMLTDDSILVLSQNIKKLSMLTHLDLSFSEYRNSFKVSDNVMKSLSESISHLKNLAKLQLDFNYQQKITNQGFVPLSKSFSSCSKLSQITLEFCNAKITDEGIVALSETLSVLTMLRRINFNFSENLSITESGANAIVEHFTKIKQTLKSFNLRLKNCPNIGEKGNQALETFIKEINTKNRPAVDV